MINSTALLFILVAVLFGTVSSLFSRHALKKTYPYAYSLVSQVLGTIVFFPFIFSKLTLPEGYVPYVVLIFAGLLWAIVSLSWAFAAKAAEVSVRDPLSQSKVILVFIFGSVFLGEPATISKFIGTMVVFAGLILLVWHPERKFERMKDKDVVLVLVYSVLMATATIVDKFALRWFTPEFYIFAVYFIPSIVLLSFLKNRTNQVKHLFKHRFWSSSVALVLSFIVYYAIIKAYSISDVTLVYPILSLSTVLTTIGGIFVMKERGGVVKKIISSVIIVIGLILLGH